MSGLLEIVQSQPIFQGHLRDTISAQIQQTKQLLSRNRRTINRRMEESSRSSVSIFTTILEGAQPLNPSIGGLIIFDGIVRKQSSDMVWKRRYLCIRAELQDGQTSSNDINPTFKSLSLILSVSKETMWQQCILTPFSELEDVFPVPNKYNSSNAPHVFAVAFKTGKRLSFQARNNEERDMWMSKIQDVLGIGDEEGENP
ncbi:unnamed protein product [Phytomonas sp. Hart1]|nr:unnamed protein product [Phytomonas sp. Hart1]|eukprot:CCW67005.1 unnamed protein product [Phytomonas sp. isolate Hart1]